MPVGEVVLMVLEIPVLGEGFVLVTPEVNFNLIVFEQHLVRFNLSVETFKVNFIDI